MGTSRRLSCLSSGVILSSAKALLMATSFNMTLTASRLRPNVLSFSAARDRCCDQRKTTQESYFLHLRFLLNLRVKSISFVKKKKRIKKYLLIKRMDLLRASIFKLTDLQTNYYYNHSVIYH